MRALSSCLMTYAFILILDDAVKFIWGARVQDHTKPDSVLPAPSNIGTVVLPAYNIFIIIVGFARWCSLPGIFLARTETGRKVQGLFARPADAEPPGCKRAHDHDRCLRRSHGDGRACRRAWLHPSGRSRPARGSRSSSIPSSWW